jgi:hypothetical protein
MRVRHIIDESGMRCSHQSSDVINEDIDDLLDRIEIARERGELVARSRNDIYDAIVTERLNLYDLLYDEDATVVKDRDRRLRLRVAFDRMHIWDDDDDLLDLISDCAVTINNERVESPSLALAHACRERRHSVGCLNLASSGRSGPINVCVGDTEHTLHFITDEPTHVELFRSAVEIENMGEGAFQSIATSAFPDLRWADGVWGGLRDFSRPYIDCRASLVLHLGVLNDFAAELFHRLSASHPEQITPSLASHGVTATDENGRAKRNNKARENRTRRAGDETYAFWWHTKLRPDRDRIHFMWCQDEHSPPGDIVVGIFTRHCYLPG